MVGAVQSTAEAVRCVPPARTLPAPAAGLLTTTAPAACGRPGAGQGQGRGRAGHGREGREGRAGRQGLPHPRCRPSTKAYPCLASRLPALLRLLRLRLPRCIPSPAGSVGSTCDQSGHGCCCCCCRTEPLSDSTCNQSVCMAAAWLLLLQDGAPVLLPSQLPLPQLHLRRGGGPHHPPGPPIREWEVVVAAAVAAAQAWPAHS